MTNARTHYFCYDGVDSRDYGIYLSSAIKIGATQPNVDSTHVPGRNGDILSYDGSYSDISVVAEGFVHGPNAAAAAATIAQWTVGNPGYHKLEFSFEDGFRMARALSGPDLVPLTDNILTFTLEFVCSPQVYTHSGQEAIQISNGGTLHNPWMDALPEITIRGVGNATLTVGDTVIKIVGMQSPITLDSETWNAHNTFGDCNDLISAPQFPVLPHGDTKISWTGGGVVRVEVKPRWWHL